VSPLGPPSAAGTLEAWLDWQQSLHPTAIELGLERVARVLGRTGWRRPARPVITVGGTNGKGSCVALLEAMLRAGGYRVGSFTSPHLLDYRERIRLDGRLVSEGSLLAAFGRIAAALGPDSLTFFEFNTLAALLVLETFDPDVLVLEVGMGGRLDAVNVVDADVALIASIGLDHTEWLGADVESIGREKAGIFRRGQPAVCAMAAPPASVAAAAAEVGARLLLRGRDFEATERSDGRWDYSSARQRRTALPRPALPGRVQFGNAAAVIATLDELSSRLPLRREAIERGLTTVSLPGRFQRLADPRGFEWVLDVAHNVDAARVLAENLREYPVPGRTIAVCGMLGDKDIGAVLRVLAGDISQWLAASTSGPRGLTDAELVARGAAADVVLTAAGSVTEALARAAATAREGDRVLVFGSFHTVGPALSALGNDL